MPHNKTFIGFFKKTIGKLSSNSTTLKGMKFKLGMTCLLWLLPFSSAQAQFDSGSDDTYDPFADYSEFDEAAQEEADIHFFRNGRFFTLGLVGGMRNFTENWASLYGRAPSFGANFTFFFDMRFAVQASYLMSSHSVEFRGPSTRLLGQADFSQFSGHLKYFINPQNMTRGVAKFNPYVLGGFSSFYRIYNFEGQFDRVANPAMSFDLGAGIEIPILRDQMYIGAQATYHLVNFPDENSQIFLNEGTEATGIIPRGDIFDIVLILGINF